MKPEALRMFCGLPRWLGRMAVAAGTVAISRGAEDSTSEVRLHPPRGELPPGFWELHLWHVIGGSVVLAIIMMAVVWWFLRSRPAVQVPPAVAAHEELEPLKNEPESGALLSRVSQATRRYFSAVLGLPEGELTTAEFTAAVAENNPAKLTEVTSAAVSFLKACDERKFSSEPPAAPLRAADEALRLIDLAEHQRRLTDESIGTPPAQARLAPEEGGSST